MAEPIFDAHAHVMPPGSPNITVGQERSVPVLLADSPVAGRITINGEVYRQVRSSLWDVDDRLNEMDRAGIAIQAVSPVPVMLSPGAPEKVVTAYARWFNEWLFGALAQGDGRLVGVGTVPLPHVSAAVRELENLGGNNVHAVEIGTHLGDLELDAPELMPFWDAAEALDMVVFVHPVNGGAGSVRRKGFVWDFGIGMLTDTAMAAGALVFGGVLERHPNLRFLMSHGCGTFHRVFPRMQVADRIEGSTVDRVPLLRQLWIDSLVFDAAELQAAVHRFGADRVVIGSDHPFIDGQPGQSLEDVNQLLRTGALGREELTAIRSGNAHRLFDHPGHSQQAVLS